MILVTFGALQQVWAAEPVDWVWTAKYVVTMDAGRRVLEDGAVAVRGDRIVAVGPRAEVESRYTGKQRRDWANGIVMPGLVNTHTHAAMSLLRGVADDLRLQDWLEKTIFPAEAKNVTPEFVRWGTRLTCLEMALGGTTTFTDMYYFEEEVAEAAKEAGLRGVLGETVIQFPVADAKTPAEALKRAEAFIQRYRHDALVVPAVAPHALYTNDDATLQAARALANKYDVPLLIHLAETKLEVEESRAKRGVSPTVALDRLGVFNGRTVAAHAVWVDREDLATLERKNVGVAHCPSSNMKLASGVAPVTQFLARGIPTGLGPDGPAGSNNDFDLLEEANLAANLQKVTRMDPEALTAKQVLEMATVGGARVLGLQGEIGSLEVGKRADVIALSLDEPRAQPLYNVYSQLAYALKGSDVRDVMVNGRMVVRDRKVLTVDQGAVLGKAREYGERVRRSLGR